MTARIIIVEGPDNCGKTTLAKAIAFRLNGNYWHMTSGPGLQEHDAMELYQKDAFKNAVVNLEMGHTTVFDRHFPSDQVYGPVLRGRASMEIDKWIDESKAYDVLFIFCDRIDAVAKHEANQDPDHPYDSERYAALVQGYRNIRKAMEEALPGQVIGYNLDNFIDREDQLNAFINGLKKL